MQTYFIQDSKCILVERSICTQSILSAIQLINTKIARSCGAGLTYNSYTFRVGVSVLQNLLLYIEKNRQAVQLWVNLHFTITCKITNLLFHIDAFAPTRNFLAKLTSTKFGNRWAWYSQWSGCSCESVWVGLGDCILILLGVHYLHPPVTSLHNLWVCPWAPICAENTPFAAIVLSNLLA